MSNFKRQHPVTIFTGALKELKGFLVPIFLVFIFSLIGGDFDFFGDRWGYIIAGTSIGISTLYGILRWGFFRYCYGDDAIIIKSGIIIKKHRHIKKERIQTINLEAGIILRLLNLSSIRIETAGNLGESEAQIDATSLEEANLIKKVLTEGTRSTASAVEVNNRIIEVDAMRLFKAGLTSGGIAVVMVFMVFLLGQFVAFLPSSVISYFEDLYVRVGVLIILLGIILFILVAWITSIFRYVIRHAFFTIKSNDSDIEITRGLFVRKTLTIKPHRIQAIVIKQGLLRQPFKYASIEVKVAGGKTEDNVQSTELHPFIKLDEIQDFLDLIVPGVLMNNDYQAVPKRAWIRYTVRNMWAYLTLIPLSFVSLYFLWLLLVLPISLLMIKSQFKLAGYHLTEDTIYFRKRVIAKQWIIAKRKHVQSLHFNRSLFQRLRNLSTVTFSVLAAPKVAVFNVLDIGYEDQKTIYQWLSK